MPPNVVLIVMDTARADAFEPYGARIGSTPTTAQLASRGVACSSVFSTACWTVPSHASMFTGALPRDVGLGQAPGGTPVGCRPVMESLRTRVLPEVLRAAGYSTVGVSTNAWIAGYSGFATGFDEFHLTANRRGNGLSDRRLRSRLGWGVQGVRARVDDGAEEAERILTRSLDSGPAQPFFWFVNLTECHSPYLPPRPYNDLPARQRLQAAREARRHLTQLAIWRASLGGFDIPEDAIARMRHLYQRSVRAMDDWLARFLEMLERRGLLDETIVFLTSDHGENLGEGNLIGHAFSLDNRLIEVPFVVSDPDVIPTDGLISLVDLPKMVAGAVGLDEHPWLETNRPAGVALAQMDALGPRTPATLELVEDWGLGEEAVRRLTLPVTCATDGRFKLLHRGPEELVFDVESDPLELSPLDGMWLERLGPLLGTLRAAVEQVEEAHDEVAVPEPEAGEGGVSPDEAAAIEERMRLLGYL